MVEHLGRVFIRAGASQTDWRTSGWADFPFSYYFVISSSWCAWYWCSTPETRQCWGCGCSGWLQHLSVSMPGPKFAFSWTGVIPVEAGGNSTVLNKNSSWPIIHLYAMCPGAKIHSIDKWLGVPQELEVLLHRAQTKPCFRQHRAHASFICLNFLTQNKGL